MFESKENIIGGGIYLYLTLPILIFFIGWLRWYWAIPFCVLVLIAGFKSFKEVIQEKEMFILKAKDKKVIFQALLLIALWVYLSGIGGFCFQNSDHGARNAIFRALVEYDWPVISNSGDMGLVYYIGFWLPAACIGKLFGLTAGYTAQFEWAVLGVFIVYYLICVFRQKVDLLPILFLVFFSGLDYIGVWLLGSESMDLNLAQHLEWWSLEWQYSSLTVQLFWVFNQAIPAWIVTMLIMVQKSKKNILFVLSLLMLSATFPFVGLLPIVIYICVKEIAKDRHHWRKILSFQNVVGVVIIGIVCFLYLIGNISGGMMAVGNSDVSAVLPITKLLRYLLFYVLEFGIYLYFICKYNKIDAFVLLIAGILVVCPFIKIGSSIDFCARASIPALFVLMLWSMETFEKIRMSGKRNLFVAYCVILIVAAITPFNEIHRSIRETWTRTVAGQPVIYLPVSDVETDILVSGNFAGEVDDSFFYQYLAKSPHK